MSTTAGSRKLVLAVIVGVMGVAGCGPAGAPSAAEARAATPATEQLSATAAPQETTSAAPQTPTEAPQTSGKPSATATPTEEGLPACKGDDLTVMQQREGGGDKHWVSFEVSNETSGKPCAVKGVPSIKILGEGPTYNVPPAHITGPSVPLAAPSDKAYFVVQLRANRDCQQRQIQDMFVGNFSSEGASYALVPNGSKFMGKYCDGHVTVTHPFSGTDPSPKLPFPSGRFGH